MVGGYRQCEYQLIRLRRPTMVGAALSVIMLGVWQSRAASIRLAGGVGDVTASPADFAVSLQHIEGIEKTHSEAAAPVLGSYTFKRLLFQYVGATQDLSHAPKCLFSLCHLLLADRSDHILVLFRAKPLERRIAFAPIIEIQVGQVARTPARDLNG